MPSSEPERRAVGIDCRLTVATVAYEVEAELAGETVVVWWGLFDQELWVEHREERFGPYHPVGGPVPLHRYRRHRKSRQEVRADRVGELAPLLALPRAALSGKHDVVLVGGRPEPVPVQPFRDPDPFHQLVFPNPLAARRAITGAIRRPLAPWRRKIAGSSTCWSRAPCRGPSCWRRCTSGSHRGAGTGQAHADRGDALLPAGQAAGGGGVLRHRAPCAGVA